MHGLLVSTVAVCSITLHLCTHLSKCHVKLPPEVGLKLYCISGFLCDLWLFRLQIWFHSGWAQDSMLTIWAWPMWLKCCSHCWWCRKEFPPSFRASNTCLVQFLTVVHFPLTEPSLACCYTAHPSVSTGSTNSSRVLTRVDGAVCVDGGQDAGQRAGGFLLNLVTGQQFKLLWRDWREAIKLEGEVDVVGPVEGNRRWWRPDKDTKLGWESCSLFSLPLDGFEWQNEKNIQKLIVN